MAWHTLKLQMDTTTCRYGDNCRYMNTESQISWGFHGQLLTPKHEKPACCSMFFVCVFVNSLNTLSPHKPTPPRKSMKFIKPLIDYLVVRRTLCCVPWSHLSCFIKHNGWFKSRYWVKFFLTFLKQWCIRYLTDIVTQISWKMTVIICQWPRRRPMTEHSCHVVITSWMQNKYINPFCMPHTGMQVTYQYSFCTKYTVLHVRQWFQTPQLPLLSIPRTDPRLFNVCVPRQTPQNEPTSQNSVYFRSELLRTPSTITLPSCVGTKIWVFPAVTTTDWIGTCSGIS